MSLTPIGLQTHLDRALANTGLIGYFCLIDDDLVTNLPVTASAAGNTLTTATPHGLVTGSRIRVATSGGTIPAPLSPTIDYFVGVVSATEILLYATLAQAIAATSEIDLISTGSGVQINEQALLPTDAKEAILAHEVTGNGSARQPVAALGAAIVTTTGKALKNPVTWSQAASGGDIIYRHIAFVDGGNSTIGDTTGILTHLQSSATAKTIADTSNALLSFQFGHEN